MIPARRISARLLPSLRFRIGSSKDLDLDISSSTRSFSADSSRNAAQVKLKPSKEKLARKLGKLEKKREIRAVRKVQLGTRQAENRVTNLETQLEQRTKLETAHVSDSLCIFSVLFFSFPFASSQDLTAGLDPFSDAELDGMYRGLLGATPEELSPNQQLVPPSSPLAIAPPQLSESGRKDRIVEWEERMDQAVDFVAPEGANGSLAARLSSRRTAASIGTLDILPVERIDSSSLVELQGMNAAQRLLFKLEVLIKSAEAFVTTGDAEDAIMIPLGVATRSEWRDLVLDSVSWLFVRRTEPS